jgi:DNA-binding transcriptional MerR regulator
MEMSMTTTTTLAQQIASTRSRRRRPSPEDVARGSVVTLMVDDARIESVLEVKLEPDSAASGSRSGVSIAEAARRTGVSVHTLRYYERAGLVITDVERTAGGRRRYRQIDLDWITICTRLRATGMPIEAVRRYAQLVTAGRGNEQERLALLETHRADVIAKIGELEENLRIIDHKIDVYRGRLAAGDADRLWAPVP